ncbi:MAG TPA: isoprenyl transferase [Myxococcota bacterium]|nr:isoprenyl transferase [Myxococcota bacterium]
MTIPRHVAIIMDGNGRWATSRGLPRLSGHEAGAESVRDITRACREWGVQVLTLYSFSSENWKRPADEVAGLMGLLARYLLEERAEILQNNIRLETIGETDRLPLAVRASLKELMLASRKNTGMVLNLALSYGGRSEIVEATRKLAKKVATGRMRVEQIDEAAFSAELQTASLPDPDLVVRTSGEFRVSNFLLWQLAYAEFYVTETLWPDFRREELRLAFEAFGKRERRFGLTGAQVKGS